MITAARKSAELLEYLQSRRSVPLKDMGELGPSDEQIYIILKAAARVPDHGKLFPWHFIVFKGEARETIGKTIRDIFIKREPAAPPEKVELEASRFKRAPVVITVISRIRPGKHPAWEQFLSAGAACQNLCLAANALGFGTNWVTEWLCYDDDFRAALGLDERDNIAGFIYIGTPTKQPEERDRPDLSKIATHWSAGASLNKGDGYDKAEFGLPRSGFQLPQDRNG